MIVPQVFYCPNCKDFPWIYEKNGYWYLEGHNGCPVCNKYRIRSDCKDNAVQYWNKFMLEELNND